MILTENALPYKYTAYVLVFMIYSIFSFSQSFQYIADYKTSKIV